jgi:hypothetical protein
MFCKQEVADRLCGFISTFMQGHISQSFKFTQLQKLFATRTNKGNLQECNRYSISTISVCLIYQLHCYHESISRHSQERFVRTKHDCTDTNPFVCLLLFGLRVLTIA